MYHSMSTLFYCDLLAKKLLPREMITDSEILCYLLCLFALIHSVLETAHYLFLLIPFNTTFNAC